MKRTLRAIFSLSMIITLVLCLFGCDVESLNKSNVEINLDVDLNNKIELRTLFPNSGMETSVFESGWTTRYFEEKTGYKVKYEQATDTQTNVVNTILTSSQPYHMFKLESSTYMALVSGNNFVDLKPALEKYGKNLLSIIPQKAWDTVTIDGKIYGIPEVGFGQMIGSALVWNMDQLKEAGITKVPETMTEVTDAFYALKTHFKDEGGNKSYYSFAMASPSAYIDPIAAAFDLNKDFYVNENNEISHVMNSEQYLPYIKFLNKLVREGVISREWEGYDATKIYLNMARGNLGCGYLPYWYINSLVSSMASSSKYANEDEARNALGYSLTIRGDGTNGSAVQTVGKTLYSESIGYYISIPVYMAEYGAYVIDWLDKKITNEVFEGYRLGEEGVHYQYSTSEDPEAIKVQISGVDKYIKLLPAYNYDILPTSMYQTGGNPTVGKALWALSEQSYKCWDILVETDYDNIVTNDLSMIPYIEGWSEVDESARAKVITYEQSLINAKSDSIFDETFESLVRIWNTNYWTDEVNNNVQNWFKNSNRN